MKVNRFDVVELNDGNKATILNFQNNGYLVEVVGHDGKSFPITITNAIRKEKNRVTTFLFLRIS